MDEMFKRVKSIFGAVIFMAVLSLMSINVYACDDPDNDVDGNPLHNGDKYVEKEKEYIESVPEGFVYEEPFWHYSDPEGKIEYCYDINPIGRYNEALGFYYEGRYWIYEYEDGMIKYIIDDHGERVGRYDYLDGCDGQPHGILSGIYYISDGKWIEDVDCTSIACVNKVRCSMDVYLLDEKGEEGIYTYYGKYVNPTKIAEGNLKKKDDPVYFDYYPFLTEEEKEAYPFMDDEERRLLAEKKEREKSHRSMDSYEDEDQAAEEWASDLLSSPNYGAAITSYSSGWYNNLSTVELLARCIYCEAGSYYTTEQYAVSWVIRNRIVNGSYGTGAWGVMTFLNAFGSVTGGAGATYNSRNPSTGSNLWSNATYMACLMLITTNSSSWNSIIGSTLNGQLNFYSYTIAKNNGGSPFSGTSAGSLYVGTSPINNIYALGYGYVNSFPSLFNNFNPPAYSRDIYYDYA